MGYITRYELTLPGVGIADEALKKQILEAADKLQNGYDSHFFDSLLDCYEDAKWYENEEDMRAISKAVPGVLFRLDGSGEEQGDRWVKWFRNGKMQVCHAKVTFEGFDEQKLR